MSRIDVPPCGPEEFYELTNMRPERRFPSRDDHGTQDFVDTCEHAGLDDVHHAYDVLMRLAGTEGLREAITATKRVSPRKGKTLYNRLLKDVPRESLYVEEQYQMAEHVLVHLLANPDLIDDDAVRSAVDLYYEKVRGNFDPEARKLELWRQFRQSQEADDGSADACRAPGHVTDL